jgi:uncharacterized protein involved in exopolysaccharide biosynthesis
MELNQHQHELEDRPEFTFIELVAVLSKSWRLISLAILVSACISIFIALSLPNYYIAETTISPNDPDEISGGLNAQLGMVANIAGVSLRNSGRANVQAVLATIRSRNFTRTLIEDHALMIPLFAGTWDEESQESSIDAKKYDESSNSWLTTNDQEAPTHWDAYQLWQNIVSIREDRETGLITVSVEWIDPYASKQWANWIVSDINQNLKDGDMAEASGAIEYLQGQLDSTQLVEMQRVFFDLIEVQMRTLMLADVREEYYFRVIDPAVVPQYKSKPNRVSIVMIGFLLGAMLGIVIVVIRQDWKKIS